MRRIDRAAPRAGLAAALLDEVLEALEIPADPCAGDADGVAHVLDHAFRIVVDLQHDAGGVLVDAVERHDAAVLRACATAPRDPSVRYLLGDLGFPALLPAADLRAPHEASVIELADFQHAFHEARELLELGPLVVGGAHGNVHVDGFFDVGHGCPSFRAGSPSVKTPQVPCHPSATGPHAS